MLQVLKEDCREDQNMVPRNPKSNPNKVKLKNAKI